MSNAGMNNAYRIPIMIEVDISNERIIKEYIDGPTIYELVENNLVEDIY